MHRRVGGWPTQGPSCFAAARGERERDGGAGMGGAGRAGERRGSAGDREARSGSESGSDEKSAEQDFFFLSLLT